MGRKAKGPNHKIAGTNQETAGSQFKTRLVNGSLATEAKHTETPTKANPSKGGHAKPRVWSVKCGAVDSLVAEGSGDNNSTRPSFS